LGCPVPAKVARDLEAAVFVPVRLGQLDHHRAGVWSPAAAGGLFRAQAMVSPWDRPIAVQSVLLELGSVCGIGLQRFHRISFLFSRRAEPVAEAIVPPTV